MHRMTTKNPRLTITLQPGTSAQLVELSRLTGDSQSAIIADILEKSAPVFERVIKVLSAAEHAKAELKGRMASDLEQAQAKIESQLGLALDGFDAYTGSLLEEVEAVRRRARRAPTDGKRSAAVGARGARTTPPSNRGVRSTANPLKKAKATP
jgi:hypothetical protein